jgi:hypothetical protein
MPNEKSNDSRMAVEANTTDLVQKAASSFRLTNLQTVLLKAIAENIISEDPASDRQIAERLGVDRKTITRNRNNENFAQAMSVVVRDIVKGNTDQLISTLWKHGQKNYKAIELLLKYSGLYTERHQSLTLHANVSQPTTFASSGDAINAFLTRLGELGWNSQRLAQRFEELRSEGAF